MTQRAPGNYFRGIVNRNNGLELLVFNKPKRFTGIDRQAIYVLSSVLLNHPYIKL